MMNITWGIKEKQSRLQYWTPKYYYLRSYNIYIYEISRSLLYYSQNQIMLGIFRKGTEGEKKSQKM